MVERYRQVVDFNLGPGTEYAVMEPDPGGGYIRYDPQLVKDAKAWRDFIDCCGGDSEWESKQKTILANAKVGEAVRWLEDWCGLHESIECIYVVDGMSWTAHAKDGELLVAEESTLPELVEKIKVQK